MNNRYSYDEDEESFDSMQDMIPNKKIDELFGGDDEYEDLLGIPKPAAKVKAAPKSALKNTVTPLQSQISQKRNEQLEHQRNFKPQVMVARVKKMSNMGYSEHERILKLCNRGLSYYSKVPKSL